MRHSFSSTMQHGEILMSRAGSARSASTVLARELYPSLEDYLADLSSDPHRGMFVNLMAVTWVVPLTPQLGTSEPAEQFNFIPRYPRV